MPISAISGFYTLRILYLRGKENLACLMADLGTWYLMGPCAEESDGGHGRVYLAETSQSGGDAFYKGKLR